MIADLEKLDATVIGVSMDTLESHRAFAKAHALNFPLIADAKGELAAKYGVSTRGGYAKRVTFIIGADKKIVRVYPRVVPTKNATDVLAALKEASGG